MQDEEEALSKVATTFQKNRVDFLLQKLLDSHPYMYFQTQPNKEPIKVWFFFSWKKNVFQWNMIFFVQLIA